MIPPFPFVEEGRYPPVDGLLQRVPKFCRSKTRPECEEHYKSIANRPGFYKCPFGFTSYCEERKGNRLIYTCLRVSGEHDRKALKTRLGSDDVPILQTITVLRAASSWKPVDTIKNEILATNTLLKETMIFLNGTVHEIRALNAQIKASATDLSRKFPESPIWKHDREFKHYATRIFQCAALVSMRLDAFDFHLNPQKMTRNPKIPVPVHKRFHKSAKILETDHNPIQLRGTCHAEMLGYPIFDMLPFVLLDNACKFSATGDTIEITFESSTNSLKVFVKSIGPAVEQDELPRLTEFGFRGQAAAQCSHGDGIGLALAKDICDLHEIKMSLTTSRLEKSNHLAEFIVILEFAANTLTEAPSHSRQT